jgi:hypothetical protein
MRRRRDGVNHRQGWLAAGPASCSPCIIALAALIAVIRLFLTDADARQVHIHPEASSWSRRVLVGHDVQFKAFVAGPGRVGVLGARRCCSSLAGDSGSPMLGLESQPRDHRSRHGAANDSRRQPAACWGHGRIGRNGGR